MDAAGAAARGRARAKAEAEARKARKQGSGEGHGRTRRYVVRGLIVFEVVALTALAGYGILTNVTAPDIAAVFATPRPTPTATPTPAVTLPATGFTPSGPTTEATVERVVDGDTIVVDADGVELYIRYLGMDAPEAVKLDTPVQFMAPEATQANAQLVSGQIVILERDVSESDDSARLLRHVWVDRDGTLFLVGLELVKAGFALATPLPARHPVRRPLRRRRGAGQGRRPGHLGRPAQPGAGGQRRTGDTDPVAPDVHQPRARRGHRGSQPVPWRRRDLRLDLRLLLVVEGHDGLGHQLDHPSRLSCRLGAHGTGHRARHRHAGAGRPDAQARQRHRGGPRRCDQRDDHEHVWRLADLAARGELTEPGSDDRAGAGGHQKMVLEGLGRLTRNRAV